MKLTGSCLCGEVQFEAGRPDPPIGHCQCAICRQANTISFISTVGILPDNFRWTSGEQSVTSYEWSIGKLRHFCSVCGSYLADERLTPGRFIVRLTALDDDLTIEPPGDHRC